MMNIPYLFYNIFDFKAYSVQQMIWIANIKKWSITGNFLKSRFALRLIIRFIWFYNKYIAITIGFRIVVRKNYLIYL